MSLKLNEASGFYLPAFFYMHIDDEVQHSDTGGLKPTTTLIHEYCHFLQDLTTSFGLMNMIQVCTELQDYAFQASKCDVLSIPMKLKSTAARHNADHLNKLLGNKDTKNLQYLSSYIKDEQAIIIDVINENNEKEYMIFGCIAILESMAYCLELSLLHGDSGISTYPYRICELLVSKIYGDFPLKPEYLFALCDASLLYDSPPLVFIETLERMKDQALKIESMCCIYDFVFNLFSLERYQCVYRKNFQTAISVFEDLFGSDGFLDNEKKWVLSRLQQGYKLRSNSPTFWCEILDHETKKAKQNNMTKLWSMFGSPVISDRNHYTYVQDVRPEDINVQYDILQAFYFVYSLLSIGSTSCPMYYNCKKNHNLQHIVSDLCIKRPWTNAKGNMLCPAAKVIVRWQLCDKVFSVYSQ